MITSEKVIENRVRRVAARRWLRLERSHRRDKNAADYGIYYLWDGGLILCAGSLAFIEKQLATGIKASRAKKRR